MMTAMMNPSVAKKASAMPSSPVFCAYGLFLLCAGAVWHLIADGAFSSILTLSVMFQCLAVALLCLQVIATGSAAGISARALMLDALGLCCRLSSTLWLNGYLPVDASGDYVFQLIDICSLGLLLWLLHQILVVKKRTYQADADSRCSRCIIAAMALFQTVLFHGNMNGPPIFNALWMVGVFITKIAVMHQQFLVTVSEVGASHRFAARHMAVSFALSGVFIWLGEQAGGKIGSPVPLVIAGVIFHAILAILGAHVFATTTSRLSWQVFIIRCL